MGGSVEWGERGVGRGVSVSGEMRGSLSGWVGRFRAGRSGAGGLP